MIARPAQIMANPVSIRSYAPDDLRTLAGLRLGRPPSNEDAAALARWLGQPNIDPARDCLLAFDAAGAPAGYAVLTREPAIGRGALEIQGGGTHRGGGAGDALLREAAARARAANLGVLHVDVPESDEARQRAFAERGWRHARTHLHLRMERASRVDAALPADVAPGHAEREDAEEIAALQNAAFAGSWGYAPNTAEEIAYRVFDLHARPDRVVTLRDAESEALIAYCWSRLDGKRGIVGMVGVAPERQGQGLGRAVTGAGVNDLIDLGAETLEITVDSENPAAIRVYESLGFAPDWRSLWRELRLAG